MATEKRLVDVNDAQKVKKALAMCYKQGITSECAGCVYKGYNGICMDALMEDALALINSLESCIDSQTTVDAVEVVRCKDCKWLYNELDDYCCRSHRGLARICENSFCSYGERKDNG